MSAPAEAATDRWYRINGSNTLTAKTLELVEGEACSGEPESGYTRDTAGIGAKGSVTVVTAGVGSNSFSVDIALDNDGVVHYLSSSDDSSKNVKDVPIRSYQFSQINQLRGIGSAINTACLYGHKVADTPQAASITQIPTTGAPSSDMVFPMVAVAVGAAGVAFGLGRRRRRV